jgi:hypothetical protein
MKYSVPVTRKVLDVYIVEAKNPTHAAFIAATDVANGGEPTQTRELSRQVGSAKRVVDDEETLPGV